MHGTWKVTGFGLLGSLGMLGFAAMGAALGIEVAVWLLARIWWILGSSAGVTVAAMLILARLMRWARARDERDALAWERRRVQPGTPAPLRAEPVTELPRTERPAIAPAVINLNFYGVPAAERATIIRTAIEGNEPS